MFWLCLGTCICMYEGQRGRGEKGRGEREEWMEKSRIV